MATTQKEIAARLGVSRRLVSLALSGHPSVAERTREKIRSAARQMGYDEHSNRDARQLIARRYGRRVRTGIIAVLQPHWAHLAARETAFFGPLLDGIEIEADREELDVFLCSARGSQLPRLISAGGVDGVVILYSPREVLQQIEEMRLPAVAVAARPSAAPGAATTLPAVVADDREGTRLTTRHLIQLGHRRIAYLGYHPDSAVAAVAVDRLAGYRQALEEHGLPVIEDLVEATVVLAQEMGDRPERLVARTPRPTGLVCYNDRLAMTAVNRLQAVGLRVPEDVSVVGFDDISPECQFRPALTSIRFDRRGMGQRAVELLRQRIEGSGSEVRAESEREVFPVELVIRESSAPPPG